MLLGSCGSPQARRTDLIWVAEPPASCRTYGTAASTGGDDDSRHEGGGGDGRQGERAAAEFPAWGPGADRHSATSSERRSRLSPPLLPSHTCNNQDDKGGGERRRRRCRRRRLNLGQTRRLRRHQQWPIPQVILLHGAWWTPTGARCTCTDACSRTLHWWQGDEHDDGKGAATAAVM